MSIKVNGSTLNGYEALPVDVQCTFSRNLPGISIVGLGNKAVDEAKERVRSAINSSGLTMPRKRIIINLAPADVPKQGSSLDLPLAAAILQASGQLPEGATDQALLVGELSLSGHVGFVQGILGHLDTARRLGLGVVFIPEANIEQAKLSDGLVIIAVRSLRQLYEHLNGDRLIKPLDAAEPPPCRSPDGLDFSAIKGQSQAKRALTISLAGRHNLLMSGPPGTGKSLLAKAARSLLPPLDRNEVAELTHLYSLQHSRPQVITCRPFRSPHHTTSNIALVGGGRQPKPGEVSLAHKGILFLDELLEFPRNSLETLRQPLEDKAVNIIRTDQRVRFPADFMLLAAANPCPCGFLGDDRQECNCPPTAIYNYQKRLSGPLMDRFDIFTPVLRLSKAVLSADTEQASTSPGETIAECWRRQKQRNPGHCFNSELSLHEVEKACQLDGDLKTFYIQAADKLALSTRGFVRSLRVARTISDLDKSQAVTKDHLLEALSLRLSRQSLSAMATY